MTGLPGKVSNCGVCGSWDLVPVMDMGLQPLPERHDIASRYPLALLECMQCTLVQLSYIPPQSETFPEGHTYATGNTAALREHFAGLAASLGKRLGPGDLVVDIGANDGTLLAGFSPDVRCVAVEPTGQAARCRDRGFRTWQQFFTSDTSREIVRECGKAKVVTACNVLAHVPDPAVFVHAVTRLLDTGGIFVTENHDVASVLDGLQVDAVYHEHLRYYSVTSLSRLLAMHGLVVVDVEKIATHGGSFRVTARRQRTDSLAVRAETAAAALRKLLASASEDGPVYGIGAATRATPLIHYADIAEYLTCVCEVTGSAKIGTVMPGTGIPVMDEEKLITDQPPHALLFAWPWADSIVPALRAKGYAGKIIVPLPDPGVLDA